MSTITRTLAEHGGVASLTTLRRRGATQRQAALAVERGETVRLRNGWFALPGSDEDVQSAVRIGGQLTAVSRLSRLGLWTMPDPRIHVSVADDATRLRSPHDRRRRFDPAEHPNVCLHWSTLPWDPPRSQPLDSVRSSIARLVQCQSLDAAVVAIDSALNHDVLEVYEVALILAELPKKYAKIGELVDGASQSGLETLARVRLRRHGVRVRIQVEIANVGAVDVLIGERLILELDSRAHHLGKNYERDRSRDLELFRQGFTVIRVSYQRAMYDWASVESAILDAIRRGEHLRRAVHRRQGLALG